MPNIPSAQMVEDEFVDAISSAVWALHERDELGGSLTHRFFLRAEDDYDAERASTTTVSVHHVPTGTNWRMTVHVEAVELAEGTART